MSKKDHQNQSKDQNANTPAHRRELPSGGSIFIGDSATDSKSSEPQTITQSFATPVRPGLRPKNK